MKTKIESSYEAGKYTLLGFLAMIFLLFVASTVYAISVGEFPFDKAIWWIIFLLSVMAIVLELRALSKEENGLAKQWAIYNFGHQLFHEIVETEWKRQFGDARLAFTTVGYWYGVRCTADGDLATFMTKEKPTNDIKIYELDVFAELTNYRNDGLIGNEIIALLEIMGNPGKIPVCNSSITDLLMLKKYIYLLDDGYAVTEKGRLICQSIIDITYFN